MSISPVQSGERSLAKRVGRKWVEGNNRPSVFQRTPQNKFKDHNAVFQSLFYTDTSFEERITRSPFSPEHLGVSAAGLSSPPPAWDGTVRRCSSDSARLVAVSSRRISHSLCAEGARSHRCVAFVCGVWRLNLRNEWRLLPADTARINRKTKKGTSCSRVRAKEEAVSRSGCL